MDLFGIKARRRKQYIFDHRHSVSNVSALEYKGGRYIVYVDTEGLLRTACGGLSVHFLREQLDVRKLETVVGIRNTHVLNWLQCMDQLILFYNYLINHGWNEQGLVVTGGRNVGRIQNVMEDLGVLVAEVPSGKLELVCLKTTAQYKTPEALHGHLMHLLDQSYKWGKSTLNVRRDILGFFQRKGYNCPTYYFKAIKTITLNELMTVLTEDLKQNG